MNLSTSLSNISGVGPTFVRRLGILGLKTVEDLINYYPFRYDDFSQNSKISQLKVGDIVTLDGEIWSIKNTYTRFHKVLTQATFNDGTGTVELIWFHQPWLTKNIKVGDRIRISGKIGKKGSKINVVAPKWERSTSSTNPAKNIHTGRLVPVYPEIYGLTSKWLRQKIATFFPLVQSQIIDPLPPNIKDKMIPLTEGLSQIHFPSSWENLQKARERLSFDELFFIQLATQKKRLEWQKKKVVQPLEVEFAKLRDFIKSLSFTLTSAQKKVISEIANDLEGTHPMNRLLQGEVGSGKTVVAAVVIYLLHLNELCSVLMAPTEILAFQHYQTLSNLLEPYGISVGIYTGSRKFNKQAVPPDVIVGTHALLSDKLNLEQVGLVVIDEQQRFGVEQRSILRQRSDLPHFLTMTATPIPRTVALTLYGDLDLSIIDELPKERKVVRTYFVPSKKRSDCYNFIAKRVQEGEQVYVITPLIERSETLSSAKAARVEFERLKKEVFTQFRLGLLHGRLKSKEKEEVIRNFREHKIDILVSTTVVEVGVDVRNATIMLIEGAERFGLAQLHQLRGRVGRGEKQSYAFLFTESDEPQVVNRVKNLEKIHNGLKLAELDLKIRGGGEIFGLLQSGRWNLKIAQLSDLKLVERTRRAALDILREDPSLDKYPLLTSKLIDLAGGGIMPD